ncbi:MAG: family 6 glucosyltransferase [Burkholderiales bacterium]|nr:family 6 glucosyltransferase [Burkholderiales bacterium]
MKVAILYICTGKYDVFWNIFYNSSERHFCESVKKHYFVFTDSKKIESSENTTVIYQDNLGWPFNTMYRYKMFLRVKAELLGFDKVIFFNGNCLFNQNISYESFFGENKNIVACIHPGFYNKSKKEYTYENRVQSLAFIKDSYFYVQGAINGGNAEDFIRICEELATNIDKDLENGIVAIWHDESHWNAYLNNNYEKIKDSLHILSPSYLYPEGWDIPFDKKIILRDKNKYGGHESLRVGSHISLKSNLFRRFLSRIRCK